MIEMEYFIHEYVGGVTVYRLGLPEGGITEEVFRNGEWVDCSPDLVSRIVSGEVDPIDLAQAQRFTHTLA